MESDIEMFRLTWEDLQGFKEICKAILNTNIAVKKFQLRHAQQDKYVKMQQESIDNSIEGLKLVDTIENAESINGIVREAVGDSNWANFVSVLSIFSGTLCDPDFYDYDKRGTEAKKKGG